MSDQKTPSRQERRVLAREQRRAAQRAAALALENQRKKEAEKEKEPRIKPADALGLAALPLGYAGMTAENNFVVGVCLAVSGIVACAPIAWHPEIRKWYRVLYCVLIAILCYVLFSIIREQNVAKELSKNDGVLTADNQPRPQTHCQLGDDDFAIFGGGGVFSTKLRPSALLSMGGQDLVKVDATASGDLQIKEIHLLDDQNESLVEIRNNKLWVHPNARRERPDFHTLIVFDRHGKEALSLKFLNHNTISIAGVFRVGGHPSAQITDSEVVIGGLHFLSPCMSGGERGFAIN